MASPRFESRAREGAGVPHTGQAVAWLGAVLLLLVLAGGCSRDDPPAVPAVPVMTDLYVANRSAENVVAVHLKEPGAGDWGENLLPRPVRPGNWFGHVARVESGTYDVRILGETREVVYDGIPIVSSYLALTFNPPLHAEPPRQPRAPR